MIQKSTIFRKVSAYYDSISDSYDKEFRVMNDYVDQREKEIFNLNIEDTQSALALDFGCGTGRFTFFLREKNFKYILGVDPSPRMIEVAQKKNVFQNVAFQVYSSGDIVFHNIQKFSLLTSMGVVEFQEDSSEIFSVIKENLNENGIFFFDIINKNNPFIWIKRYFNAAWRDNEVSLYTIKEIRKMCNQNNVEIISLHGVNMWLMPKGVLSVLPVITKITLALEMILSNIYILKNIFSYRIIIIGRFSVINKQ